MRFILLSGIHLAMPKRIGNKMPTINRKNTNGFMAAAIANIFGVYH